MGPIWNTSGTETVISVPVSVLGPERAGTEMGCILCGNLRIRSLIGLTPERKLDYFLQK